MRLFRHISKPSLSTMRGIILPSERPVAMKFTDKYELLESLTTGTVETFVANDKVRGEQVLVHILECRPQKPGQSVTEWVLEAFRQVAPEPVGPVLETGKYGETKYVYLVTKPSDDAAQRAWVRRYEVQGQDTQETMSHPKPVAASVPPVATTPAPVAGTPPPVEPERPTVSVTQLLRNFESQHKPAPTPKAPPATPLPNLSMGSNPSGLHSAPAWEPVRPIVAVPAKEEPRSTDDSREKGFASGSFPAPPASTGFKDTSKPGEFTSFFQGPFGGDRPSDVPSFSSQPTAPPQKKVGEFTAVFGSVSGQPEQAAPLLEESGNISAPGTFTSIFKDMDAPPRNPNAPSLAASRPIDPLPAPPKPKQPIVPVAVVPPPPVISATPVVLPTPPMPIVPIPKPVPLPGDGATGAFSRPAAPEPVPVIPATPVGPSPYTQIISRDKLMPPGAAEEEEDAGAPASAGKFGPPAMPKAPPLKAPKAPQVKMPPPPKLVVPPAPKAPKVPAVNPPAPPPVSMMPLVLTLTVLFFLAVLLVLYFVLKH